MGSTNKNRGLFSIRFSKALAFLALVVGMVGGIFSLLILAKPILSIVVLFISVVLFIKLNFLANIIDHLNKLVNSESDGSKTDVNNPIAFFSSALSSSDKKIVRQLVAAIVIVVIAGIGLYVMKDNIKTAMNISPNGVQDKVKSSTKQDKQSVTTNKVKNDQKTNKNLFTKSKNNLSTKNLTTTNQGKTDNSISSSNNVIGSDKSEGSVYDFDSLKKLITKLNPIYNEPHTINFLADSEDGKLRQLSEYIKNYNKVTVKLVGHTHTIDNSSDELKLSVLRAKFVKDRFDELLKNDNYYFDIYGQGADKMVKPDANLEEQWLNRRVEMELILAE